MTPHDEPTRNPTAPPIDTETALSPHDGATPAHDSSYDARQLMQQLGLAGGTVPVPQPAGGTVGETPDQARRAADWSARTSVAVPGYAILGELGRGGMGVVYKAKQEKLNRTVALKMVLRGAHLTPTDRARFLAEAEAVAAITHPHVVQVFEFGEHAGQPYFAMEFLDGGNLSGRIKDAGRLSPTDAAAVVEKIARGVQAAHDLGIVHRDLKPANVLLDAAGEPKVTDFGLAKRGTGGDLTHTNVVMGSPHYMPPEQAGGRTKFVGPPADVWALGVILYECLTGTRPFDAESVDTILSRVLMDEPTRPQKVLASIPRDLELICLKCLEKNPADRYPTAGELADDLIAWREGRPVTARPIPGWMRFGKWVKRNRRTAAGLAAIAAALIVGAGVATWQAVRATAEARRATEQEKETDAALRRETTERERATTALGEANTQRANAVTSLNTMTDVVVERMFARQSQLGEEEKAFLRTVINLYEVATKNSADSVEARTALADGYCRIAQVRRNLGDWETAVVELKTSQRVFKELLPVKPSASELRAGLARTHADLGLVLRDLNRMPEAEAEYRAALVIQQQLVADFPAIPTHRDREAAVRNNLGLLLHQSRGQYKDAEAEYRKCRDLRVGLVADHPDESKYCTSLASTQTNLAGLLAATRRYEEAVSEYTAARNLRRRLVEKHPAVPEYRADLARTRGNMANLLVKISRVPDATTEYTAARDELIRLVGEYPYKPQYREDLARTHSNYAKLLRDTDRTGLAETEFAAARAAYQRLIEQHPKNQEYRYTQALLQTSFGALFRATSRPADAEREYGEARTLLQQLFNEMPTNPDYGIDLAVLQNNLGVLFMTTDRPTAAEAEYLSGRDRLIQLTAAFPDLVDCRTELARVRTNLGQLHKNASRRVDAARELEAARNDMEKLVAANPKVTDHRKLLTIAAVGLADLSITAGDGVQAGALLKSVEPHLQFLLSTNPRHPEYKKLEEDYRKLTAAIATPPPEPLDTAPPPRAK